jgi:hypothetical protein
MIVDNVSKLPMHMATPNPGENYRQEKRKEKERVRC